MMLAYPHLNPDSTYYRRSRRNRIIIRVIAELAAEFTKALIGSALR